MSTFFLTTPIYYVNAKPHLGHAYTTIVADSMMRFHRLMGRESFFLTGTDEHGEKIVQAAGTAGQPIKAFTDAVSSEFRALWPRMGLEPEYFVRTSDPGHINTVQAFLQKVHDAGDIYYGEYGGYYCYGCERFYTAKELGESGLCPQHQAKPEYISEKNYFFRMSKYQNWLRDYIHENPGFIRPERYTIEVLSLLDSGVLEDLCISRPKSRLTWGIELPFDSAYVCYVWFDALLSYVSGIGWPDGERFARSWAVAEHLVAKDILKPHAVFWPTMLKAAGLAPYRHLNVHGYWLMKDTKISKSLGNAVDPLGLADLYGIDAFRYFLLREMHFGNDAVFSEEALVGRLNADLANDLGNLFSRVLSMNAKYCHSIIPASGCLGSAEKELLELAGTSLQNFQSLFGEYRFSHALESLWVVVRALNKYVDVSAPWDLFKKGEVEYLRTVMRVLLECMLKIAQHLLPVMPNTAAAMLEQLGVVPDMRLLRLQDTLASFTCLPTGGKIAARSNLFPRIEYEKPAPAPGQHVAPPVQAVPDMTPVVAYEDFQKLDIRVGTVVAAEQHPNADKLLRLDIDLGEEKTRQIVSGIAAYVKPETLPGQQVLVVANLAPRILRGLESQGMILTAPSETGLELLSVGGLVPNGSKVS